MENISTIGQVAKVLNCNASLLRFYEKEFDLPIPRTSGNRRLYTPKEVESFRYITKLKQSGYTNPQIKAVLKSGRPDRIESFADVRIAEEETEESVENESGFAPEQQEQENRVPRDPFLIDPDSLPAEPISNADLISIFTSIAQLRDELNLIKSAEAVRDINELMEENARLKAKIKEKTYELVDAREKIQELTSKTQKKSLFKK